MKIGRRSFRQTYKVLADSNSSFHKIWIQAVTNDIVNRKESPANVVQSNQKVIKRNQNIHSAKSSQTA